MGNIVRAIGRELNPRYDFRNITFRRQPRAEEEMRFESFIHNTKNYIHIARPAGRGASIGGLVGVVVSAMNDFPLQDGFLIGSQLLLYVDVAQFCIRFGRGYIKAQRGEDA